MKMITAFSVIEYPPRYHIRSQISLLLDELLCELRPLGDLKGYRLLHGDKLSFP